MSERLVTGIKGGSINEKPTLSVVTACESCMPGALFDFQTDPQVVYCLYYTALWKRLGASFGFSIPVLRLFFLTF